MSYEDAFKAALTLNAEWKDHVFLYKCIDHPMYWATLQPIAPYSSFILVGEVRRMTPR